MPYNSVRREYLRRIKEQKGTGKEEIEDWQKRWRDAGPIEFAEHLLICPSDVPSHPDFNPNNNPNLPCNDDCPLGKEHPKFRENGTPHHLILSDDEKEFLNDVWKNGIITAIIAAARGTGKTFTLGIYDCWRITCFDRWSITCMGGSSDQSENIQDYIDDWRLDIPIIRRIIYKSLRGIKPRMRTRGRSSCRFPACSTQSARGKHVNTVEIDEACFTPENIVWSPNSFSEIDKTYELLDRKIEKRFETDHDGDILYIQPRYYGIGFRVTPKHPFWAIKRNRERYFFEKEQRYMPKSGDLYKIKYSKNRDGNKKYAEWIEAKDLRINDILVSPIPRRDIDERLNFSKEFLRLIGYYISEGSKGDHQTFLSFNENEKELINDAKTVASNLLNVPIHERTQNKCTSIYWSHKIFQTWLEKHCGIGAKNKKIPDVLMKLPNEQMDELLKAIYAGDGYEIPNRKSLHVASRILVYQILFIENSRGKLLCLHKEKSRDCYYLDTYGQRYGWIENDCFHIPIYKIRKEQYKGKVYNFKTNIGSYLLPYILVHNCEAESKSENGAKAVAAVQWQTTGKRSGELFLSSTVQYIYGTFYDYMKNPEKYGFQKVYRWAIAKHISGETDPTKVYTDKDPAHWIPNVWWITKRELMQKRLSKSDEEWLCEALGGASMASGAVFKKDDLDICICRLCEECEPYNWEKCKLCQMGNLGTPEDPTKYIIERQAGFDYGYSDAPCSLTIVGRKGDAVFVLFNDEQIGMRDTEKPDWIDKSCQQYKTHTFIPDPNASGKHLNEPLEEKGYAVYIIAEKDKIERVHKFISFVEKHKFIIPKAFWYLTSSLRKLAWDKNGKIRKIDDHSFDSTCYSIEGFEIEEGGENVFEEFLKFQKETPTPLKDEDFFKGVEW